MKGWGIVGGIGIKKYKRSEHKCHINLKEHQNTLLVFQTLQRDFL